MSYEAKKVETVARALYLATRQPDAAPWSQVDGPLRNMWFAVGIAAMDLTNGARARMDTTQVKDA